MHAVYCLIGEDMTFYVGERQMEEETAQRWTRFQRRPRAERGVLVRMKGDGGKGGEAVELLQELYHIYDGRLNLPLMAYWSYGGWNIWTKGQAAQYHHTYNRSQNKNGAKRRVRGATASTPRSGTKTSKRPFNKYIRTRQEVICTGALYPPSSCPPICPASNSTSTSCHH